MAARLLIFYCALLTLQIANFLKNDEDIFRNFHRTCKILKSNRDEKNMAIVIIK